MEAPLRNRCRPRELLDRQELDRVKRRLLDARTELAECWTELADCSSDAAHEYACGRARVGVLLDPSEPPAVYHVGCQPLGGTVCGHEASGTDSDRVRLSLPACAFCVSHTQTRIGAGEWEAALEEGAGGARWARGLGEAQRRMAVHASPFGAEYHTPHCPDIAAAPVLLGPLPASEAARLGFAPCPREPAPSPEPAAARALEARQRALLAPLGPAPPGALPRRPCSPSSSSPRCPAPRRPRTPRRGDGAGPPGPARVRPARPGGAGPPARFHFDAACPLLRPAGPPLLLAPCPTPPSPRASSSPRCGRSSRSRRLGSGADGGAQRLRALEGRFRRAERRAERGRLRGALHRWRDASRAMVPVPRPAPPPPLRPPQALSRPARLPSSVDAIPRGLVRPGGCPRGSRAGATGGQGAAGLWSGAAEPAEAGWLPAGAWPEHLPFASFFRPLARIPIPGPALALAPSALSALAAAALGWAAAAHDGAPGNWDCSAGLFARLPRRPGAPWGGPSCGVPSGARAAGGGGAGGAGAGAGGGAAGGRAGRLPRLRPAGALHLLELSAGGPEPPFKAALVRLVLLAACSLATGRCGPRLAAAEPLLAAALFPAPPPPRWAPEP
eukprot:tig00001065_g6747.t1